jgi:hypothetical protein
LPTAAKAAEALKPVLSSNTIEISIEIAPPEGFITQEFIGAFLWLS